AIAIRNSFLARWRHFLKPQNYKSKYDAPEYRFGVSSPDAVEEPRNKQTAKRPNRDAGYDGLGAHNSSALTPNGTDHRPRASRVEYSTKTSSRGSVHPFC